MAPLWREFGISRNTGYKLFNRCKDAGLDGLKDKSRTPYVKELFDEQGDRAILDFVFGADNDYGQVMEPKKVVTTVIKVCGGACNCDDLRWTFATTAEHLDIGHYKLKRLMNHVSGRNHVTAGYTVLAAETLRSSAERIQEELLGEQI